MKIEFSVVEINVFGDVMVIVEMYEFNVKGKEVFCQRFVDEWCFN